MVYYKTYFVQNSKTREVQEKSFEGTGIDDFDTRYGVPIDRALRIINNWNRMSAKQAHNHGNIQFTYFLD